jgi:hypothetical protein
MEYSSKRCALVSKRAVLVLRMPARPSDYKCFCTVVAIKDYGYIHLSRRPTTRRLE